MPCTWMIRADQSAQFYNVFRERSIVALGLKGIGSLQGLQSISDAEKILKRLYPHWGEGLTLILAAQLFQFGQGMSIGDQVITASKSSGPYLIGTVYGEYRFESDLKVGPNHVRPVKWIEEISGKRLSPDLRNALSSVQTLFRLPTTI